jgi:hypothetical protein
MSIPDERQVRTMTDDEATNMRLEQWWTREMELLQELVDSGKLSGPSIGMAARGLWNMAYKAGAEWARKEALREAAEMVRDYWDACGELIDSNNGARLAFEAVAAQIADGAAS